MNIAIQRARGVCPGARNLVAGVLTAAWLAGCGGGSGPGGEDPVIVPPTDPTGSPAPGCAAADYAANWDRLGCPQGTICVGNVDATGIVNVEALTGGRRPAWSPDGQRLAFHRLTPDHYNAVFVIGANGSGETMLAAGTEPAWSPDGTRIAFVNNEGIAVMATDGSAMTTLVTHDFTQDTRHGVGAPAWSPDGQQIVFEHHADFDVRPASLYVMNADGSDPRRLTSASGVQSLEIQPAWSPDGGSIAFLDPSGLVTLAVGATTRVRLVNDDSLSRPAWSPDGSSIAYTKTGKCALDEIDSVNASGGGARTLLVGAREPAWSPDGARIAFASAADAFPPVAGTAAVYVRVNFEWLGARSRFVLHDDGTFEYQSVSLHFGYYVTGGTYDRTGDTFTFDFFNESASGPWTARGTLDGVRLTVVYNLQAALSDFEDGVYVISDAGG